MTTEATGTPAGDADPTAAPPPAAPPHAAGVGRSARGASGVLILALVLVAFIGGIALTMFGPTLAERWHLTPTPAAPATAPVQPVAPPRPALAPQDVTTLEGRVAALTLRLDTLSTQAQNAGSFATRAESIMIVAAARRALDSGAPLGYLENELRARFGEDQPKAVATIISAASEPVTLSDLQAGLEDATPRLISAQRSDDWWTAARRELSNMVIIRRVGAPSRVPQKAMEQARALLISGRVDAAMAEVERLPGRKDAEIWLEKARRYNEARRALDVIEAAAILEPRLIPPALAVDAPAPAPAGNAVVAP